MAITFKSQVSITVNLTMTSEDDIRQLRSILCHAEEEGGFVLNSDLDRLKDELNLIVQTF